MLMMLTTGLIFAGLTAGGMDGGVPQAVIERLKNEPVQVVSQMSVYENGTIHHFATIYVRPYYLIVKVHRVIEGWRFGDDDIYEVFILKGEQAITIWERSPPN